MLLAEKFIFGPLSKLLTGARLKHYPKSQILLYSGDVPNDVYILKEGVAKMYDIDNQGNEKILHLLKPPGIMPLTFLRGRNRAAEWFYNTVTDCDVYTVPRADVERQIESDGQLAMYLMSQFGNETHELLVRLSGLSKTDTANKLLYVLRFLAARHARERYGGWRRVTFPVSHQLLADMIGMTRESTAISMKQLREQDIIRYPRTTVLEIHFKNLLSQKALAA